MTASIPGGACSRDKSAGRAELKRLQGENEALRNLLGVIRAAAASAPQSVHEDQAGWLDRMMFLLVDIEGAARGCTQDGHSAGVCASVLASGTMAKPVSYRVYEGDGERS